MNNISNHVLNRETIENIINKYVNNKFYRVVINDPVKFQQAFVHKSFCIVDNLNSDADNYSSIYLPKYSRGKYERLEFLGDKVIELVTTEFLFDKYPEESEGFLTKLKARIVRKATLSMLGEKLGFQNFMLISSHIERINGRNNKRYMEDIFESFVGALYKDQNSNFNTCKDFVLGVYKEFLDIDVLANTNDNYKDTLMRYYHTLSLGSPEYRIVHSNGDAQNRDFVSVLLLKTSKISDKITDKTRNMFEKLSEKNIHNLKKNYNHDHEDKEDYMIVSIGDMSVSKKESEQSCCKKAMKILKINKKF